MKKIIFSTIILILAVGFSVFVIEKNKNKGPVSQSSNNPNTANQMIFFYGETCPHCLKVEKFLAENKVEEKNLLIKKEVYRNKDNAHQLMERAQTCGLSKRSVGVPFLWTGQECLVGDQPIIDFLKKKLKEQ